MGLVYSEETCSSCVNNSNFNDKEFNIKQGDTCPTFTISIIDPITGIEVSYENWLVEVYMHFESCLKSDSGVSYSNPFSIIKLMRNMNLCLIKIGDIIEVEDCNQNLKELMLVMDVDYETGEITVERGYEDSDIYSHKKGDKLLFYRIYGKEGYIDNKNEENIEEDVEPDYSIIGYQWDSEDTSHKGKYYLEFKLTNYIYDPEDPLTIIDTQIRSFPISSTNYVINII